MEHGPPPGPHRGCSRDFGRGQIAGIHKEGFALPLKTCVVTQCPSLGKEGSPRFMGSLPGNMLGRKHWGQGHSSRKLGWFAVSKISEIPGRSSLTGLTQGQ